MLKRFTRNEGGVISVDVVAFEKELKSDPVGVIKEMKKESQEKFDKKFPKMKPLK